ncbi:MAG TPA: hypothetical protein VGF43_16680 [Dongiaceae bacterium]|jgi:hypothetical protein
MNRAQEYRERAGECVEVAQIVEDTHLKIMLLQLAQQWIDLARISEHAYPPDESSAGKKPDQT